MKSRLCMTRGRDFVFPMRATEHRVISNFVNESAEAQRND